MSYEPTIFPELKNKKWAKVNLGQLAKEAFFNHAQNNPLLDAEFCNQWVENITKSLQADFTWGGHFEDRQELWRGYYSEAQKVTHLGVDYNVPAGTLVSSPTNAKVIHSWADKSNENGWGGRLILEMEQEWQGAKYLILGHLAHENLPPINTIYKKGDIITKTGKAIENGGWFPHLHVQCASQDFLDKHKNNVELLDGYYLVKGEPYDFAPNPSLLVGEVK